MAPVVVVMVVADPQREVTSPRNTIQPHSPMDMSQFIQDINLTNSHRLTPMLYLHTPQTHIKEAVTHLRLQHQLQQDTTLATVLIMATQQAKVDMKMIVTVILVVPEMRGMEPANRPTLPQNMTRMASPYTHTSNINNPNSTTPTMAVGD